MTDVQLRSLTSALKARVGMKEADNAFKILSKVLYGNVK